MNAARMDLELALARHTILEHIKVTRQPRAIANVIDLPGAAVRIANSAMFAQLCTRVRSSHGAFADLIDLQTAAERAVLRFPVPIFGPGLARVLAEMTDGRNGYRNILGMLVHAEALLSSGECLNTADAIVRAFATHHRMSLADIRAQLIQASHDCEFFSPEVVLMFEALSYG